MALHKIPSLVVPSPASSPRKGHASGEYRKLASGLPQRNVLELERRGPISEKEAPPPASREMEAADFEDEFEDVNKAPSSVLELQMEGLPIREEAWPKSTPVPASRIVEHAEERRSACAIP